MGRIDPGFAEFLQEEFPSRIRPEEIFWGGVSYDFGASGFLYRSNKLMYDQQTRTLWNQLTGEPILGKLAG